MTNRSILISGASVAGPALAYWLRRYGYSATVVERAPALRGGGQAIDLRGTAQEVVERMGIMEEIRRAHTGTHGMSVVNGKGKRLADMSSETMGGSGGLIAEIEILRGDLVRILYEASRAETEYLFDDSIISITEEVDGVYVTFERAAPRRFDLVIGADGLHSNVRRLAFGEEAKFTKDMGCNVATFATANEYQLDGWELIYQIPGSRGTRGKSVGMYPLHQNTRVQAMFYFATPDQRIDRHNLAQQQRALVDAYAGVGWEVPRLLAAMRAAPEFYFDQIAQVRLEKWARGRVALLGDAAYCPSPLSGMGTSLAIVGAYVLAGELAIVGDDFAGAFARYQATLQPAVQHAQKFADGAHRFLLPDSQSQIWMISQAMRLMAHLPFQMSSGVEKAATAVTLKDYPLPRHATVARQS